MAVDMTRLAAEIHTMADEELVRLDREIAATSATGSVSGDRQTDLIILTCVRLEISQRGRSRTN